ncbi:MAG: hypothetical protein P8Y23_12510, partial [Candidatus Lokiarchaeota archaeon]
METIKSIEQLLIPTNIIFYDKKTEILSIHLEIFTFIGNYKKSTRLNKILDDVYKALGETLVRREYIAIVDFVTQNPFSESTKLKKLNLISNREKEKKQVEIEEKESEIRDKKEIVTERKEKAKAGKKRKLSAFEDIIEEEPSQIEMEGEEEILAKDLDRDTSYIEEKKKESIDDEIYESVEHLRSAPKPPPKAMPSSAPSGPPSETRAEDAYAGFG